MRLTVGCLSFLITLVGSVGCSTKLEPFSLRITSRDGWGQGSDVVIIHSNKNVERRSHNRGQAPIEEHHSLTERDVRSIYSELRRSSFRTLRQQDFDCGHATDVGRTELTLLEGGSEKVLFAEFGCRKLPPQFVSLLETVGEVLRAQPWWAKHPQVGRRAGADQMPSDSNKPAALEAGK